MLVTTMIIISHIALYVYEYELLSYICLISMKILLVLQLMHKIRALQTNPHY